MARRLLRSNDTEFRIVDEALGERAVGLRIEIVTSDSESDDELGLNFGALRICDKAE
jgi:hypothetical protein